jgi:hypothetical protein
MVLFHEIYQQMNSMGLEVDVPIQSQQVRVLGDNLLALYRDRKFHETMTKKVIHVHNL